MIIELSREEGRSYFDIEARDVLGISGEDFLRLYDMGVLDRSSRQVLDLEMLIPFARSVPC